MIRSDRPESRGESLDYTFTGTVSGDDLAGELDLGEYRKGRFRTHRRAARS